MWRYLIITFLLFVVISCTSHTTTNQLPFLGEPTFVGNDTIYPEIPDFKLINQNNKRINNQTFRGKICVASFIFLDCPTICPVMTKETQKVYKHFQNDNRVVFISHTIDPEHDTVEKLKAFTKRIGINDDKWHFVTGDKKQIYDLAEQGYFSIAGEDSTAPGGYIHSGSLLLVDENKHIRGVYDGTNKKETKRLIRDIELLLKE
jgi:protein SCO1/2